MAPAQFPLNVVEVCLMEHSHVSNIAILILSISLRVLLHVGWMLRVRAREMKHWVLSRPTELVVRLQLYTTKTQ
jgi:hypothetical protein